MTWASLQSSPSLASIEAFLSHKSTASLHSQWLLALPWLRGFRCFWLSDGRVTQNLCPYLKFRLCAASAFPFFSSSGHKLLSCLLLHCDVSLPMCGSHCNLSQGRGPTLTRKDWPRVLYGPQVSEMAPGHPPLPPLLPGIWIPPPPPPLGSGFLWGYLFV